MADSPNVALTLSSLPQSVSLVRTMLSGVAESIELDRSDHDDIRAAVTEACNNVVLHAYPGAQGPLEVEVFVRRATLEVLVRDRGIGLPPAQLGARDASADGLGLPMMRALTRRLQLRASPAGGSEARLEFATPSARALGVSPGGQPTLEAVADSERAFDSQATLTATIAPAELARAVLPRLLSALAARAHFSTDRIADAQLLADALAAYARQTLGNGPLGLAVEVEPRDLRLRIGPFAAGEARRAARDVPIRGLGEAIEGLTDAQRVSDGAHEVLSLRLLDRR
jgi:serine/threonine-protein kinase RsbW